MTAKRHESTLRCIKTTVQMVCSADENGFLYLMGLQPVGHLLGNALDAALLKGNFQSGSLQQLGIAGRTGAAHKAQIALPCILVVGQAQQEELQRGHGGQAVVDIIEGALINVQLTLPACTAAIEGKTGKIDPRAVLLFQLEPLGIAFIGGQVDLFLSKKTRLMILGDWITQFTYAVFDGEHMFQIGRAHV